MEFKQEAFPLNNINHSHWSPMSEMRHSCQVDCCLVSHQIRLALYMHQSASQDTGGHIVARLADRTQMPRQPAKVQRHYLIAFKEGAYHGNRQFDD